VARDMLVLPSDGVRREPTISSLREISAPE
jgi:hypothetical protein